MVKATQFHVLADSTQKLNNSKNLLTITFIVNVLHVLLDLDALPQQWLIVLLELTLLEDLLHVLHVQEDFTVQALIQILSSAQKDTGRQLQIHLVL